ncbi:MAG TPA: GNAT family N-acetyltransferase [Actinomycetota bacterium]|nr:GNAT family N-acetyltransferase [Actinomycetota bacterium]
MPDEPGLERSAPAAPGEGALSPAELESPPPSGIGIRPARSSDAASYFRMWKAVVDEGRWVRTETVGSVKDYRRTLGDSWSDDRARFVALAWGQVVGLITIERMSHPVNRHVATLGMAIESSWRGQGLGSALMAAAMRWARQVGVEKLTLEVYPDNDAGIALYRKFGFHEEGRLVGQSKKSFGYRDEVIMSRWLTEAEPDE